MSFDKMLEKEFYDWKDIIFFLVDDFSLDLLELMINEGNLPDMSQEERLQFRAFLENKLREELL